MPLINCEESVILTWYREFEITSMEKRTIINTRRGVSPTNLTFQITNTKLYAAVITLSTENDKNLLKQLRIGYNRTIKWSE